MKDLLLYQRKLLDMIHCVISAGCASNCGLLGFAGSAALLRREHSLWFSRVVLLDSLKISFDLLQTVQVV
jgi:hypothetical protein